MIKKIFSTIAMMAIILSTTFAQEEETKKEEGYVFTPVIDIPHTSVKDQNRSGTCWSFSGLSFIEAELLRMGKPEFDLSEMFVVYNCYAKKAEKYVRMHGSTNFGGGGAFHDVTWTIKNYGMVPNNVYTGLTLGEDLPVHGEMDAVLSSYVETVIKNPNRKLSPVWDLGFEGLLDSYLGEIPEKFEYEGETYTPQSFASDVMGLDMDDYVEIGSYTHHPFYEQFAIEIPDNWLWDQIYNVPLNEMIEIIDNALENGYTIAWAADVSDKGFASKNPGVAVIPDVDYTEMSDAEIAKWEKMSTTEKNKKLYSMKTPGKEKVITQEMRQINFDDYTTTDDHGMHIVGTATDQNGTTYYTVKNSWGDYNDKHGYFYASKAFVALQTTDIMINKNAIPKNIRKKLNID